MRKIKFVYVKVSRTYSVFFFYWVKSICSFDPLKIASDWSNISQILCLDRTFDKDTLRLS